MADTIAVQVLERTTGKFVSEVFPSGSKPFLAAAGTILRGIVRTGTTVLSDLGRTMGDGETGEKGVRERLSGWLERYDFDGDAKRRVFEEGTAAVGPGTTIAVDLGDISKEFGGGGMEGMAMGYDGSRGVTAMGHDLVSAAAVPCGRGRAVPIAVRLHKGRRRAWTKVRGLCDAIMERTGGRGVLTVDRGGDSEAFVGFLLARRHRAVVRVKDMGRDIFGTGRHVDRELLSLPVLATVRLRSAKAEFTASVRWRPGWFGPLRLPVLAVASSFGGHTVFLYALPGGPLPAAPDGLRALALAAARNYFERWSIEVLFQDIKQFYGIERARVRTFRRLRNLLALCVLAHVYMSRFLPAARDYKTVLKAFRDNFRAITTAYRAFIANFRELLAAPRVAFITGRPRKRPRDPPSQMVLRL